MMEVEWWRELSWRVVATAASPEPPTVRAWMLKPDDGPDGTWTDLTFGVVELSHNGTTAVGSWYTRGWVARSEEVDLVVGHGPPFEQPQLVWVGERHSCDGHATGGWAGNDYFFRPEYGQLGSVDELVTVDPSEDCVQSIAVRFEPDPPLRFITTDNRYTHTFTFDPAKGSFQHTSLTKTAARLPLDDVDAEGQTEDSEWNAARQPP